MDGDRQIRVSDLDRDAYRDVLRAAYAEGRINEAEFEERLTVVLEARFEDDLAPTVVDLPAADLLTSRTPIDADAGGGGWILPNSLTVPPLICTAIYAMTDFGGYFWPMWVWFGCMVPVLFINLDVD
ncbi:MAG: DUF1707 domain-containing protein [Actinomycetota bacterium]